MVLPGGFLVIGQVRAEDIRYLLHDSERLFRKRGRFASKDIVAIDAHPDVKHRAQGRLVEGRNPPSNLLARAVIQTAVF